MLNIGIPPFFIPERANLFTDTPFRLRCYAEF